MRLIDADEIMEHTWRDRLDSRELIAKMIETAPTVKEVWVVSYLDENGKRILVAFLSELQALKCFKILSGIKSFTQVSCDPVSVYEVFKTEMIGE